MAVGATGEDSNQVTIMNDSSASGNNDTSNSGAVYIFERTGTSWAQVAYIKPPNPDINEYESLLTVRGEKAEIKLILSPNTTLI